MEYQSEGYEARADAYIPKPFNAAYLPLRTTRLLDYQEKLQELFRQERLTSHITEKGLREEDKTFLKSVIEFIEVNMDNEELNAD